MMASCCRKPWESEGPCRFDTFVGFLETHCTVKVVAGSGSNEGSGFKFSPMVPEQGEPQVSSPDEGAQAALLYQVTFQSPISEENRKKIIIIGDVCCGPADPQDPQAGPYYLFVNANLSGLTFQGKVEFKVRCTPACSAQRDVRKT